MIPYLTELVQELKKQGYEWVAPIEVGQDHVRVKDGRFGEFNYYISREGGQFKVSLYIEEREGKLSEVPAVERESIGQVVDYIME